MGTLEAWVDIKSMHRQGRSIRSIAKELGVSRNTVRRYLRGTQPPSYERRAKRPSLLDPFKDYLGSASRRSPKSMRPCSFASSASGATGGRSPSSRTSSARSCRAAAS